MLKRQWALAVLAVGGTLFNIELLGAASSRERQPKPDTRPAVARIISAARSYGLSPNTAAGADTPHAIAFSERETVFVTILALEFIATLPCGKDREQVERLWEPERA